MLLNLSIVYLYRLFYNYYYLVFLNLFETVGVKGFSSYLTHINSIKIVNVYLQLIEVIMYIIVCENMAFTYVCAGRSTGFFSGGCILC